MRKLRFGVELEVISKVTYLEASDIFNKNGIQCSFHSYGSKDRIGEWKIQPDSSLRGLGWELISPPLEDFVELEKAIDILKNIIKAKAGIKTGFHVHHDINNLHIKDIKNLFNLYQMYEETAIKSIINPKRYENDYCKKLDFSIEDKINQLFEDNNTVCELAKRILGRYYSLNLKSFIKHGTIEFRKHQGTTNIKEIEAWILLTNSMISLAIEEEIPAITSQQDFTIYDLLNKVKLNDNKMVVSQYRRAEKYIKSIS